VGVVKKLRRVGQVSPSAIEDHWQRLATTAAIEAARGVVKFDGPIPPLTPIGRLNDVEGGWILSAMLFAWIVKRSEQATAEQIDTEQAIRLTGLDPEPWDIGAINTILPELADACPGIDWSQPLASWSREMMADFLLVAMRFIRKAMIARDLSGKGISRKANAAEIARQANAAAGGPLMTPDELNDKIGI
jgi:hypothetical protein